MTTATTYPSLTDSQLAAIASCMDDDIRQAVHLDLAPCSPGAFLDEYLRRDPDFPVHQFSTGAEG